MTIKTAYLSLFVYFDISRCMDNYYIIIIYIYICIMREHPPLATFPSSSPKNVPLAWNVPHSLSLTHSFSLVLFFTIKEWKGKSNKKETASIRRVYGWFYETIFFPLRALFFNHFTIMRMIVLLPQCFIIYFFVFIFMFLFHPRHLIII